MTIAEDIASVRDPFIRRALVRMEDRTLATKREVDDVSSRFIREMGDFRKEVRWSFERLGVDYQAFVRARSVPEAPPKMRDRTASGSALDQLVEEVTNPGVPSNPVRAFVERGVGRVVLWVLALAAMGGATLAVEHFWTWIIHR